MKENSRYFDNNDYDYNDDRGMRSNSRFVMNENLEKLRKKEQEVELLAELRKQVDYQARKKEFEKNQIKKEKELDDLRVFKDIEELEQRSMMDYTNKDLESRNLHETNFDFSKIKTSKKLPFIEFPDPLLKKKKNMLEDEEISKDMKAAREKEQRELVYLRFIIL